MKYFSIFACSLLLHFLLGFSTYYLADVSQSKTVQPVEIFIPESSRDFEKQIVRETDTDKKDKPKYDLKPRFFSETTKQTDQETRAAKSGLTQNRSQQAASKPQNSTQQDRPLQSKDGAGSVPLPLPSPRAMRPLPTPGASTVGENLPEDIKVGEWTSLNTERYLFYTFFARIEERVRFHWERAVRETAESVPPRKLIGQEWVTNLEVILDPKGNFERVIFHRRSGIEGFDFAAANAFRIGSPYLNPPQELIQKDGRLHLKYSITVFYAPPGARM